jgi:MFS family permease
VSQPSARDLFANKSVLALLVARTASATGYGFHFVAISWLVLLLHGTAVDLAILLIAGMVPATLVSLHGGVLVDRYDRRRVAQVMDLFRAGVVALVPLLAAAGVLQIWQLYVVTFAVGLGNSLAAPAYSALLPEVIENEDLVRGNGLWQAATQIGALAGAGFGGLVVAYVSPYAAFWVDVGSYLVAAALLQCVQRRIVAHASATSRGTVREELVEGLRLLVEDRLLLWVGVFSALPTIMIGVVNVIQAPFARDALQAGAVGFGLLDASFGAGALVGSLLSLRLLAKVKGVGLHSQVLMATGLLGLLLSVMPELRSALATNALLGISVILANIIYPAFVQARTPGSHVGRVLSTVQWLSSVVYLLALLGVGHVVNLLGPRVAYAGVGIVLVLAGLAAKWLMDSAATRAQLDAPKPSRVPAEEVQGGYAASLG